MMLKVTTIPRGDDRLAEVSGLGKFVLNAEHRESSKRVFQGELEGES